MKGRPAGTKCDCGQCGACRKRQRVSERDARQREERARLVAWNEAARAYRDQEPREAGGSSWDGLAEVNRFYGELPRCGPVRPVTFKETW